MGLIELVEVPGHLLTAYGGKTVAQTGVPWLASRRTAAKLAVLDDVMMQEVGERPQLTDAHRPVAKSKEMRAKYDAWVRAGKPGPDDPAYDPKAHKTAYVAKPGTSFHNSGIAVDFGVQTMFGKDADGGSERYRVWWWAMKREGWRPIIKAPSLWQSESWHWENVVGTVVEEVQDLFKLRGGRRYSAYSETARACYVMAHVAGANVDEMGGDDLVREIQAQLLFAGIWAGPADGIRGAKTGAGLADLGVPEPLTSRGQVEWLRTRFAPPAL